VVVATATFLRLYMLPVVPNELPSDIRMAPVW
jgi:magnesium-protoporphyrin IX monomethyl ester (oxidative) cyclase